MTAADFDCEHCIRPDDPRYTGPTVEDDGSPMVPSEVIEHYNNCRYMHYDQDFQTARGLRGHLEARARYWVGTHAGETAQGKTVMSEEQAAMGTIDATVEMWQRRRDARQAAARIAQHEGRDAA